MSVPSLAGAQATKPQRPLWRNRDYMLLWSGQTVSSVGTLVSGIAFPLLILAITRSPLVAGVAGALRSLPYIFLSLPVGALIDRWNRKRVMIFCDAGRAVALGSIPVALIAGRLAVGQIYAVSLVEGTLFVFFNLAEVACLPRVVPPEQLPAATAQNQATESTAALVGPYLSGVLYTLSAMLPFAADAVSYAASVVSLLFIRTQFQGERSTQRRKLRAEIGEGLGWLWRQPLIRYIAFLTGGWNFVSAGDILIVILIAQHQGATPAVIGVLFAIGGFGGIVGSIIAPRLRRRLSFAAAINWSVWISALLWPLYVIAPNPFVLGALAAAHFTVYPLYNVVQFSYRLSLIPDELQGRVNSVFRLLAFGFQPLGFALTGYLLEAAGTTPTVLVFSAVMIALAISATVNPHVRRARPVVAVTSGHEAGH